MALIGKEIAPFAAKAFHKGEFIDVSSENFKGQWSVVCFYPADFTFVCPTELEDLQNEYDTLKTEIYYNGLLVKKYNYILTSSVLIIKDLGNKSSNSPQETKWILSISLNLGVICLIFSSSFTVYSNLIILPFKK